MPRKKLIRFDAKSFIKDFGKRMKIVNQNIRDEIYLTVKLNLQDIDFKTNQVNLLNADPTSDALRKDALLRSLSKERADWITNTHIRSTIHAMRSNFEESHVGLYYEYGTGEFMDKAATYESLGDSNPFRVPNTGAPIVTRSRFRGMTSGFAKGGKGTIWQDVGGNWRVSYSQRGGEGHESKGFTEYIGEDVQAYHWFSKDISDRYLEQRLRKLFSEALSKPQPLNINDYFKYEQFTLGRD